MHRHNSNYKYYFLHRWVHATFFLLKSMYMYQKVYKGHKRLFRCKISCLLSVSILLQFNSQKQISVSAQHVWKLILLHSMLWNGSPTKHTWLIMQLACAVKAKEHCHNPSSAYEQKFVKVLSEILVTHYLPSCYAEPETFCLGMEEDIFCLKA